MIPVESWSVARSPRSAAIAWIRACQIVRKRAYPPRIEIFAGNELRSTPPRARNTDRFQGTGRAIVKRGGVAQQTIHRRGPIAIGKVNRPGVDQSEFAQSSIRSGLKFKNPPAVHSPDSRPPAPIEVCYGRYSQE